MRILIMQESYVPGGADRSLADLIGNWPVQSDHFTVAVNSGHPKSDFVSALPVSSIVYQSWRDRCKKGAVAGRCLHLSAGLRCAETLYEVVQLIKRVRPDAAILNNGGFPGGSSLYLALAVIARFQIAPRVMIVRNYSGAETPRWRTVLAKNTLAACGAQVVAVSQSLAQHLVHDIGIPASRVRTIYNGVERPRDAPHKQSHLSPMSVSIVGSVEERKGHEVLIRAMAILSPAYPRLRAIFTGHCTDEEHQRLMRVAKCVGVDRQLVWRPHLDDIDSVFDDVEILVVPSIRQESFGRVAAEAMARGIPVIASDCGGLPEVVQDGVTGIVVKRGDAQDLAGAIDTLLSDKSLRQHLSDDGIKRFSSFLSAARMAHEYAALLHEGAAPAH